VRTAAGEFMRLIVIKILASHLKKVKHGSITHGRYYRLDLLST